MQRILIVDLLLNLFLYAHSLLGISQKEFNLISFVLKGCSIEFSERDKDNLVKDLFNIGTFLFY